MYRIGAPLEIVTGDGTARWTLSRKRPGGLGDAETETDCPQPVSTAERDALRNKIGEYTSPHNVKHVAEGHPDITAAWNDILRRLRGLYDRPKLLRCSQEARTRANNWIGQMDDLCRRVKSDPAHCAGFTRVATAFPFTVFRGPTYTIRASTDPDVQRAMQAFAGGGSASVAPVSSAPSGSVVVNGQVFASSAEANAAAARGESSVVSTTGGAVPSFLPSMEGQVGGIPTKYLLYGALGLVAFKMLKGR